MEVVFIDDSDVKEVGGDEENVEKEKSKQQLEAISIKEPLNNELSEDEKRGCDLPSSPQTVVADTQNNTKDEEMCNAIGVVINKDEKERNYSKSSWYSEGTEEESQVVKFNGEQDTVVVPLKPVKKKVKVMVENEKENYEWIDGRKSTGGINFTSVEPVKQDIETPKVVAVMTDDEDCSEGGSVEEDKSNFSTRDVMTDGAYNNNKRKINNRSSIIEEAVPAAIGMTMTTTLISDLKVESDVYISLGQVDAVVVTPQKISAAVTTDSSSVSTPATTISAPEIDTDALIPHNKPSCCSEEVTKSPVVTINNGSGGLSAEIMHYELQLEEAVSLFEKIYKERPDNILGLNDAIDYAIQEEGKKLMLKDDQQPQHSTDGVSGSNENSSFSSFPDVLCPALSCIIQGDGSRLDTLASMAFQTITVELEGRRCSSSSDENKSAAIDTLLHYMAETNVVAKIQLLAVRRTYGNPPPKATVTSLEDKTPSACWIWEVQCIEALPGKCVCAVCVFLPSPSCLLFND